MLDYQYYGIIATVTNLSLLISSLSCLGFTTANPKLISEYFQKKQLGKISSLLRFSFSVSLTMVTIFLTLLLTFYFLFPESFKLSLLDIVVTCIIIVLGSVYGLLGSLLHGLQKMRKYFLSDFAGYSLIAFLTFLFLFLRFGYIGALVSFIACYLIAILIRFEREWFSFPGKIDKKFVLKNYALPAFLMTIFSLFINNSQYVILTFIQNPEATGIFGTALTISFVITLIPNILSASLFPIISQLSVVKGKEKKQSYLASIVTRYILLFSIPSIIFISIFSRELILFFATESYLASYQFLPILTLASFFFGFGNYFLTCLYGIKKTTLTRNISLSFTFLFLSLTLPLTHVLSSFGLSLAYLVTMFFYFFVGLIFMKKYLQLKSLSKPLIKIIFASAIFALLLLLSELFMFRFYFKILVLFLSGLVYFVLLAPLKFYQKEEVRILNYLGRKIPFFKNFFFRLASFISKWLE